MTVMYSCHGCGLVKAEIPVRLREDDEDVADWMRTVQLAVGTDHHRRRPACRSEYCDLMIPVADTDRAIGQPALQ